MPIGLHSKPIFTEERCLNFFWIYLIERKETNFVWIFLKVFDFYSIQKNMFAKIKLYLHIINVAICWKIYLFWMKSSWIMIILVIRMNINCFGIRREKKRQKQFHSRSLNNSCFFLSLKMLWNAMKYFLIETNIQNVV